MKYIDIEWLKAEIEKRQEERQDRRDSASWENEYWPESEFSTRDDEDDTILSIIDSLQQEQPKVNLEKEIHKKVLELRTAPCYDELASFAYHFYELGLKARKEWNNM